MPGNKSATFTRAMLVARAGSEVSDDLITPSFSPPSTNSNKKKQS
jgi:hypothetical protein